MKEITLSEAISMAKQKEGEIFRLTLIRSNIITEPFEHEKYLGKTEEYSPEQYNKVQEAWMRDKKVRFDKVHGEINKLIDELVELKNKINQKNVEVGIDKHLIKMKWVRVELDLTMKELQLTKRARILYNSSPVSKDSYYGLGLGERLKALELQKSKLDGTIQGLNHTTKITIPG